MKNRIIFMILPLLLIFSGCSHIVNTGNIPKAVIDSFKIKFPGIVNDKWTMDEQNNYEAEYKINSINCSASFDNKGKWLETETDISFSELPDAVKNSFELNYKGYRIKEIEKSEINEGVIYEFLVRKNFHSKEVRITMNGNVVN